MPIDGGIFFNLVVTFAFFILVWNGVKIVPQQQAWIVQRLGRFHINLEPGMRFLIPFVDRIAYKHSLKEEAIDAATAISGSGPAYVFYFMDAMMKAAKGMGFNDSEAELLVKQTFRGAVDLYKKNDFSCEEWIAKVSSKGGTTEAAMKCYKEKELYEDIIAGANAAFKRAVELGEN